MIKVIFIELNSFKKQIQRRITKTGLENLNSYYTRNVCKRWRNYVIVNNELLQICFKISCVKFRSGLLKHQGRPRGLTGNCS